MIDTSEIERILNKLESIDDEEIAVELLREFNQRSGALGKLLLNLDPSLSHEEWKIKCDDAKKKLDEIITKIDTF